MTRHLNTMLCLLDMEWISNTRNTVITISCPWAPCTPYIFPGHIIGIFPLQLLCAFLHEDTCFFKLFLFVIPTSYSSRFTRMTFDESGPTNRCCRGCCWKKELQSRTLCWSTAAIMSSSHQEATSGHKVETEKNSSTQTGTSSQTESEGGNLEMVMQTDKRMFKVYLCPLSWIKIVFESEYLIKWFPLAHLENVDLVSVVLHTLLLSF